MSYSASQVASWAGVVVRTLHHHPARLQRLEEVAERAIEVRQTGVTLTPQERFEVVHHVGAGTSAVGLHAGVPAVPVPVTADQPFWPRSAPRGTWQARTARGRRSRPWHG